MTPTPTQHSLVAEPAGADWATDPTPLRTVGDASAVHPDFPEHTHWVWAWPFRAHVAHLAEAAGLPWQVVALSADVGRGTLRTLPNCRPRRGRIPAGDAAALYALTPERLRRVLREPIPAGTVQQLLASLLAAGVTADDLALLWRVAPTTVRGLIAADQQHVVQRRLALFAAAELHARGIPLPERDVDAEDMDTALSETALPHAVAA